MGCVVHVVASAHPHDSGSQFKNLKVKKQRLNNLRVRFPYVKEMSV